MSNSKRKSVEKKHRKARRKGQNAPQPVSPPVVLFEATGTFSLDRLNGLKANMRYFDLHKHLEMQEAGGDSGTEVTLTSTKSAAFLARTSLSCLLDFHASSLRVVFQN